MLIPPSGLSPITSSAVQTAIPAQESETSPSHSNTAGTSRTKAVKVSLSGLALQKSASAQKAASNRDIEESGLPDTTQNILKMIRELKQKIQEKQVELQAVLVDPHLDPQTRQMKAAGVQSELGALSAALTTASTALNKQIKDGVLSAEQGQQAAMLAMK
jgi:vancomycin resistance protein YoaR